MKHINALLLNEHGSMAEGGPRMGVRAFQDWKFSTWEGLHFLDPLPAFPESSR